MTKNLKMQKTNMEPHKALTTMRVMQMLIQHHLIGRPPLPLMEKHRRRTAKPMLIAKPIPITKPTHTPKPMLTELPLPRQSSLLNKLTAKKNQLTKPY